MLSVRQCCLPINIGKRIVEQELGGSERAEYSRGLISALAEDLTKEFGKNY